MSVYTERFRELSRRTQAGVSAAVMTLAAIAPVLLTGSAGAAPALVNRKLESTVARPSQTTQLTWTFGTTSDVANIKQIEIEFCDSPLSTCTNITGTSNIPAIAASPTATLTNFATNTLTSTTRTAGDAGGTDNQIVIVKTNADAGASIANATIQLGASDITNNSQPNKSYYTRMRLYSDTGTTLVWEGVFAQSTSRTLTVNARVQERLDFCVGSTSVNDATTTPGADCSAITGSSVDIGNIDSGGVNVSPVTTTNGGSNQNGIAMVRTNAVNGASVAYRALGETSSGALKVPGATCVASPISNTSTDQCFDTSTTKGTFTPGTERFGMTIAAVNCVSSTAYTCAFGSGTYNLARTVGTYDGTGANTYVADADIVNATTASGYAWDADPTHTTTIASSSASTVKVIDDEALILKFAATSGITTPTGAYTVQADFIATAPF